MSICQLLSTVEVRLPHLPSPSGFTVLTLVRSCRVSLIFFTGRVVVFTVLLNEQIPKEQRFFPFSIFLCSCGSEPKGAGPQETENSLLSPVPCGTKQVKGERTEKKYRKDTPFEWVRRDFFLNSGLLHATGRQTPELHGLYRDQWLSSALFLIKNRPQSVNDKSRRKRS